MSRLTRKTENNTLLVELSGAMDAEAAAQLEQLLAETSASQKIVLDLQQTSVIDPEGVRVLLNASLQREADALVLQNPNAEVRQLLVTVGLDGLLAAS